MALSFGTSGLRAAATAFDAVSVGAFVSAFLDHVAAAPGADVYVGCDLRASSPAISGFVVAAIAAHGQNPVWCGVIPTPALAAAALARHLPAIEITGSHIPESFNGIKFYRPDGELLKADEAPMRALAETRLARADAPPAIPMLEIDDGPARDYVARAVTAFGTNVLSGLRLGLYEHSAAGRDLLAEILAGLGAELVRFGRSERFIAVDTEALDATALSICADALARHELDAVVSTDGDGDRPLLIDAAGHQVNGDVLCTLAARALGIKTVVTPLTSTGAVELSGWFETVIRTRVGSPYVVDAMNAAERGPLAGFEANGGFLLGSDIALQGGPLKALPTRDAVLPLIAVLAEAKRRALPISALVAELPVRVMKADRLKDVPFAASAEFLAQIVTSPDLRSRLLPDLAQPAQTDLTDGVRFTLDTGMVLHFRASGNAPELRLYVETDAAEDTANCLNAVLPRLAEIVSDLPTGRQ